MRSRPAKLTFSSRAPLSVVVLEALAGRALFCDSLKKACFLRYKQFEYCEQSKYCRREQSKYRRREQSEYRRREQSKYRRREPSEYVGNLST